MSFHTSTAATPSSAAAPDDVDAADPRRRQRGSQGRAEQHPVPVQIACVHERARDLRRPVDARRRLADPASLFNRRDRAHWRHDTTRSRKRLGPEVAKQRSPLCARCDRRQVFGGVDVARVTDVITVDERHERGVSQERLLRAAVSDHRGADLGPTSSINQRWGSQARPRSSRPRTSLRPATPR